MDASGASSAIGFHERIIRAGGSPLFARHHSIASRFPKRSPVVPARASYSHSPSVGNRYRFPPGRQFRFPMNSCASFQETVSTGHCPQPKNSDGFVPVTPRHSHCAVYDCTIYGLDSQDPFGLDSGGHRPPLHFQNADRLHSLSHCRSGFLHFPAIANSLPGGPWRNPAVLACNPTLC